MSHLDNADATSISELVRSGKVSPGGVAEHFLAKTESRESSIQAFVSFDPDWVRKLARRLVADNVNGLLAGVPVGVKDNFDTADHPHTVLLAHLRRQLPVP